MSTRYDQYPRQFKVYYFIQGMLCHTHKGVIVELLFRDKVYINLAHF